MGEVVKFYKSDAAKDPDAVLEQAIGEYESVIVVGYNHEEEMEARASLNLSVAEAHFLLGLCMAMLIRSEGNLEVE